MMRGESPLKLLTEEDLEQMLLRGEMSPTPEGVEIARESFLNPERAKHHAKQLYESVQYAEPALITYPSGVYHRGVIDPVTSKHIEANPETLEDMLAHEAIHEILFKMKKGRANRSFDNPITEYIVESSEPEVARVMDASRQRWMSRPRTPIDVAMKKYKMEGSY